MTGDKMPSRQAVAKLMGRRVSRGEYERIFSRLIPKQLKTVKTARVIEDGQVTNKQYHPIIASRAPGSPKSERKKASRNG